ncbi:MAG TPA: hypothetical protein P5119_08255 [Candidatus Aminicenantes bacterium]|nr:hypothetical protein [Candidatus Aminicenantes bacterium]HRY65318.1 hypothetical protein [Candidatus Aminicenantes bacterium]HRZ72214.1 hypothetical protein [Candidatus Aminicenantes bacterium]
MAIVNLVFGGIVGAVLWPFRTLSPWAGMVAVSFLTALLMLEVYKLTSNQAAIRRAKDLIKAHLYEMRLYKDDMRITLGAQRAILKANLSYLAANLKPLAVMIVPLVLILAQLSVWYDRAPLRPGQETLVKARLEGTADPVGAGLDLEVPPGLEITAPAVRIPDLHEVVWRIKAVAPGSGRLTVRSGGTALGKAVVVGDGPLRRVSAIASRGSFSKRVLYPGEGPLPAGSPVRSIEILYPAGRLAAFGLNVHWLIAYLVLSIVFGFAFKGVFKVEI